ncbi:phosphonate ABC transporter ATP-binding protein [Pseudomonas sp. LS1212]|uniref:phosphonate ABC transporter ATP-binding protein n=1 Tax=Pseudomonas sp. LS1212 TaxID=2972478 RepID=UPI00215BBBC9|nr:phosphonate ABC transporter ATP-binding protein [Pseudomonas sp. LS1212]UVJ44972.1 phosphonate ABC transporter ATP-binding protein [Pseudomonas sp. LS1212]
MILQLANVSLSHTSGVEALKHIDLRIDAGEQVAIIGPSGAGKTTLLRVLATRLQPGAGTIELLGASPWAMSARARQKLRARIGMIHQAPPLPPRQRVVTAVSAGRLGQWSFAKGLINLCYALDANGVRNELARLDIADKLFSRCDELSGGQLQRVGIARVLYQAPELILADEPVSAMDPTLAGHTLEVLNREAQQRGTTVLASLHSVELALKHFERVIGMRDGKIAFDLRPSELGAEKLKALYANEQLQHDSGPATPTKPFIKPLSECG